MNKKNLTFHYDSDINAILNEVAYKLNGVLSKGGVIQFKSEENWRGNDWIRSIDFVDGCCVVILDDGGRETIQGLERIVVHGMEKKSAYLTYCPCVKSLTLWWSKQARLSTYYHK